jgi:isoleucine--tRNA ligase
VEDGKGLFDKENTYFVIWTTTPWTLPGNVGITIGGEFEYSIVKTNQGKLIIATALVDNVMKEAGIEEYETIKTLSGEELEGVLCKHPFLDRTSRVVLGSDDTIVVELGTGTGAVHTAPGYGKEDYLCGLKNGLEIVVTVDGKGYQTEGAGIFAGLKYDESNDKIIEWLEENKFLLKKQKINHSYPHCWRCKNPIIFRATEQWFCSVDKFKDEAIKAAETVKWIPSWGADRISNMIKERADWCISRQRTWGVPLPIYYCKECGKEYITKESIEKLKTIFKEKGSNAWWDLTAEELMPEGSKCKECGSTGFVKEKDIMDVWFDSGSTHQSVLVERGLPYPADLYLEGADQYRGWFQSSLLTSVAINGIAPYKQVLTHGWTVDGQGKKMSKSLGNGISPQDVIKEYGADILRLWVLSSDYQSDVSLSKDILKQITEVYRKMRNTARYILGNTSDFDPDKDMVSYNELQEIDKYALLKLNDLVRKCTESYDKYDFHEAYQAINVFCVTDMSSFYLDIIKDRLYTAKANSKERRAAQTTMYIILDSLVRMLAPLTSFTAEEIWKYMNKSKNEKVESVMLTTYPEVNSQYENEELRAKWEKIVKIKEIVSKKLEEARAEKIIGHSLNAKVTLFAEGDLYKFIKENKELLQTVFIISNLEVEENQRSNEEKLGVKIEQAEGEKCERCWMYSTTVGEDKENPTICHRCSEALK